MKDRKIIHSSSILSSKLVLAATALVLFVSVSRVTAQDGGPLPDAPQAVPQQQAQNQQTPGDERLPQTKRILGIIPNFRAVSTDEKLPAQTTKEKFITATQDSFDYSAVIIPAAIAGYNQARKSVPEFGQGASGYGQYFWHSAVDQTSENYMVEFVVPVLAHQDTRYYTLGRGGFWKRTGYALSRAVVTRDDNAKEVFNVSEIGGAGASAALSNAYYPASQRTFSNTAEQWGLDVGIDAFTFAAKEFWPDINQKLFHGKQ